MYKKIFKIISMSSLVVSVLGLSANAMMGKPGRPTEYDPFEEKSSIPHKPGIYYIKDDDGETKYVGQTNDLNRRTGEHIRTGKIEPGDYVAVKVAHGNSKKPALDKKEARKIKEHQPPLNKVKGTPGRPW